jgi:hypothetical protein
VGRLVDIEANSVASLVRGSANSAARVNVQSPVICLL